MKKIWMLGIIVVLIGASLLFYQYIQPDRLNMEYDSTIYSDVAGFEQSTVIRLNGELFKKPFGKNVFKGEIIADEEFAYAIHLIEIDNYYLGLITKMDEVSRTHTIGTVMTSKNIDKVWIKLDELNEKYDLQEGYISGPAKNMEEAIQIAREVISGN